MCEQSQEVVNLYMFAEIERGVEQLEQREALVGSVAVMDEVMRRYECDCRSKPYMKALIDSY